MRRSVIPRDMLYATGGGDEQRRVYMRTAITRHVNARFGPPGHRWTDRTHRLGESRDGQRRGALDIARRQIAPAQSPRLAGIAVGERGDSRGAGSSFRLAPENVV